MAVLVVAIVAIQFFHPERNQNTLTTQTDISHLYPVPDDVSVILDKACNDCHSNNTIYPWYANVQPVAWWLNDHIKEGKGELNFNEFAAYPPAKQYRKLEEVKKEIDEGEMPISPYTFIHTDARLTETEKHTLTNWTEGIRAQLRAKYPPDSLVSKKPKEPKAN